MNQAYMPQIWAPAEQCDGETNAKSVAVPTHTRAVPVTDPLS